MRLSDHRRNAITDAGRFKIDSQPVAATNGIVPQVVRLAVEANFDFGNRVNIGFVNGDTRAGNKARPGDCRRRSKHTEASGKQIRTQTTGS